MIRPTSDNLIKLIEYGSLPFAYPARFFELWGLFLTDRKRVRELVHLSKQRLWFEAKRFKTIIDVGAYIGAFSFAMKIMLPDAAIYAFEPLEDNYKQLVQNMQAEKIFQAFNTALGDHLGEIEFWRNAFSPSSSILPIEEGHMQAFPMTQTSDCINVSLARLDDYLDTMNFIPPVLLKMDVQGAEDKVIYGSKQALKQIDTIITEVSYRPLYKGQALFEDIYNLLIERGFRFGGNFDTLCSPIDGTILQSDALFYRP